MHYLVWMLNTCHPTTENTVIIELFHTNIIKTKVLLGIIVKIVDTHFTNISIPDIL